MEIVPEAGSTDLTSPPTPLRCHSARSRVLRRVLRGKQFEARGNEQHQETTQSQQSFAHHFQFPQRSRSLIPNAGGSLQRVELPVWSLDARNGRIRYSGPFEE